MEKIFKVKFNVLNIIGLIFILAASFTTIWYFIHSHDNEPNTYPVTESDFKGIMVERFRIKDSLDSIKLNYLTESISELKRLQIQRDSNLNYVYKIIIPRYNEQIKAVDTMSNSRIYEFWAELYNKSK